MRSPFQRLRVSTLGLVAALLLAGATAPGEAVERGPVRVAAAASAASAAIEAEARVIVQYRADSTLMHALSATSASGTAPVAPQHAKALGTRLGLALTDGTPSGPRAQVVRATGISSADLAARLSAQDDVEYAVVDQRVHALRLPNDSLFPAGQTTTPVVGQWYLRKPGSDGEVASIDAESAWDVTTGTSSVVVAVIDTGITTHPDLAGKVLPGYDFISDPSVAGDGDGRDSDPTDVGDGLTQAQAASTSGCTSDDVHTSNWHGTQTAGLIGAATNNGTGIAGLGWNVMLLPLRALGRCGGSESDVAAAIQWAAGIDIAGVPHNPNKAQVINLSLGGTSGVACDRPYQDAITAAIGQGVVVVAAAGNDGLALGAPANCTGVIAVAGVRHIGTKVGYSDLDAKVTIAAPAGNCVNDTGTCLYPLTTTSNDGAYTVGNPVYTNGDSNQTLGTSFASPLVAGTVALMLSANPSLTPAQVTNALRSTARLFPSSGAPPAQRTDNGPILPVPMCTAPSSVAQSYECYCTTSTCGAGLLDAGAAVAFVETATAHITPSATSVTAGGSVSFDGSASTAATSTLAITGYQWSITSGAGLAAFSGATNQSTATLVTSGAGSVVVALTVTDSGGHTNTGSSTVTVTAVASPATSSGGGGGGSVSFGWLLGLLAAVFALWCVRPHAGRR